MPEKRQRRSENNQNERTPLLPDFGVMIVYSLLSDFADNAASLCLCVAYRVVRLRFPRRAAARSRAGTKETAERIKCNFQEHEIIFAKFVAETASRTAIYDRFVAHLFLLE